MKRWYLSTRMRFVLALAAASLVSLLLFAVGSLRNHAFDFPYLVWNLLLAWIPLLLVLWLEATLRRKLWSSWQALAITVLLVIFLPNAFYVATDLIHLQEVFRVDPLFDVAMFCSFVFVSFLLGIVTVSVLHAQLNKRLKPRPAWLLIKVLLLVTSFAIYIGRDLRWSTWDVLLNPASILFEISDHLLNPTAHPEAVTTTLGFFLFVGSVYVVVWYGTRVARQQKA